jgi:Ni,Fe-hydrogenase I cytochrome b subunit
MLFETFNQIFFWIFAAVSLVFYPLIIWKAIASYQAAESKTAAIVKAIIALIIWTTATGIVTFVGAGYFADHTLESPSERLVQLESATVYLISFIIGWILVGAAIIYWMSRSANQKNYGSN